MTNALQGAITKVWNDSENQEWREDQSHWRGKGRWADDAKWQSIGKGTIRKLRGLWRFLSKEPFPGPMVALEWGQGGGANLFAMRGICSTYYGVDIAEKNLAECTRMIEAEGYDKLFQPVFLTGDPADIKNTVKLPVDLIISTSVFQHFPSKEYGVEVLKAMRSVSKSGTLGIIQIRYDNGNERFAPITDISQYEERHITATSYRIDEFWRLLNETGFHPLKIGDLNPGNNYATFYFRVD